MFDPLKKHILNIMTQNVKIKRIKKVYHAKNNRNFVNEFID